MKLFHNNRQWKEPVFPTVRIMAIQFPARFPSKLNFSHGIRVSVEPEALRETGCKCCTSINNQSINSAWIYTLEVTRDACRRCWHLYQRKMIVWRPYKLCSPRSRDTQWKCKAANSDGRLTGRRHGDQRICFLRGPEERLKNAVPSRSGMDSLAESGNPALHSGTKIYRWGKILPCLDITNPPHPPVLGPMWYCVWGASIPDIRKSGSLFSAKKCNKFFYVYWDISAMKL